MRWAEISLLVAPAAVEPASAVLAETGCAGVIVVDPNAVSSDPFAEWTRDPAPTPGERCRVSGYLPVDERLEPALEDLRRRMEILRENGIDPGREITLRTVDEDSWADAWKSFYKPLRIGRRFVVKPSWEAWLPGPDDVVLELDPGMAFGSGLHPTTRLCLTLLEETVRPGERLLDWGTGSGILAVGAARLGAREVVAIDLDPLAARVAEENAARNGCGETIRAAAGSIETLPLEPPFDRIVANIVADPIIAGAPEIRARLAPGGQAIVSGIVDRREAEVRAAVAAAGLELLETRRDEEWRALLLAAR